MPLDIAATSEWPPAWCRGPVYWKYAEWDAWFSGSPDRLAAYYSHAVSCDTPQGHMWAREVKQQMSTVVHMPLAGDIAATSAALLFSEAPIFSINPTTSQNVVAAQQRLDAYIQRANIIAKLLEAAETCAALGGVYLRATWDVRLVDYPILDVVQPDNVVPEWAWGMLRAATFWQVVYEDEKECLRHLERHEIGANGNAHIYHYLYRGTYGKAGVPIPLTASGVTADLPPFIDTGIKGLDVRYIPNMRPNRLERQSPLGVSDYVSKESLFASLDEVWTQLMNELILGKARLFVPEEYLDFSHSRATFNVDTSVFTPLNVDPMSTESFNGVKMIQPDLRVDKYLLACHSLVRELISRCGYAPQSFGLDIEGNAPSGTALRIRERKSLITQGKKQGYWQSALQDMLGILLQLDYTVFNSGILPSQVLVQYADSVHFDMAEVAQTVNMLSAANAASVEVKVRMLHPDWSDDQVLQEVTTIKQESGSVVPDPLEMMMIAGIEPDGEVGEVGEV
jgi:hypothetical protein